MRPLRRLRRRIKENVPLKEDLLYTITIIDIMNNNLKIGHTYRLVSIEQNTPCRGDCEPCSILNLLNRGFLADTVFTVKQILGGNVLIEL